MSQSTKRQNGFTIIELMISVGFIGFLLITITLTIMQIMGLYNKGLTLKEVDGVSRVVVRDLQQGIAAASKFELQYDDDTSGTPVKKTATTLAEANLHGVDYYSNPAGGRLCTGEFSYIWNTGRALKPTDGFFGTQVPQMYHASAEGGPTADYPVQFMQQSQSGATVNTPVRFVKKSDPAKAMCKIPPGDSSDTTEFDRKIGEAYDYENVFGNGDNNLMLYKFAISVPADYGTTADADGNEVSAISTFYNLSLIVGTQMGDENSAGLVNTNNATCKAPIDTEYNDAEYCAVNNIDFVARTGSVAR